MAKTVEVKILYTARRRTAAGQRHFYLFHNKYLEFEFRFEKNRSKYYARHGFEKRAADADPKFPGPSDESFYPCPDVKDRVYDALRAMKPQSKGTVPLRLRIWRYSYFSEVLHQIARPKDDGHNLGWPHPNDAPRIQAAAMKCKVTHYSGKRDGQRTYITFKDVPYQVMEVKEAGDKLQLVLIVEADNEHEIERTKEEIDSGKPVRKRIVALEFGGADWSALYEGDMKLDGVESHQMGNAVRLAWNYTRPGAGLKVVERAVEDVMKAVADGKITSLHTYALYCRNTGDERLILANSTESNEETYQKPLSQIHKSAHSKVWWASPVNFIRTLSNPRDREWLGDADLPSQPIEKDDYLDLVAQIGAGHCGEHSYMTFGILKRAAEKILKLKKDGKPLVDVHDMDNLRYMFRSGYYKEDNTNNSADHAFSIVGAKLTEEVVKKVPYKTSGGEHELWVVDLAEAPKVLGKPAYMVDAWVDGPVKSDKALLQRIKSFQTTCVMLSDYHYIPGPEERSA